jgi:hypothetical protein
MSWEFLSRLAVEAMHAEQLRRHGGAQGLRDVNALESALARAENKAHHGSPDIAGFAAAYLFGIARNRRRWNVPLVKSMKPERRCFFAITSSRFKKRNNMNRLDWLFAIQLQGDTAIWVISHS